ncbi:MAG: 2-oxo-4-hydroxy-4-carboxy-5-ureidoimidazoline decarboxylase [Pseudolabrys sp.]|nr:2-oxo-4-hydroxy-4-carboxy-5-ureidoimidazoline decarboxylase [Pseudolabrys sp.]
MPAPLTLTALNECPRDAFVEALGAVFEHAPWVAEAAFDRRPFVTVAALHETMVEAVAEAGEARQLALIRAHPDLGSKFARADLTTASQAEQGSLGLDRLSADEFTRFTQLNAAYRERFGFPFIICVRQHTRDSILKQFDRRLHNNAAAERSAALDEIALITGLRLVAMISS